MSDKTKLKRGGFKHKSFAWTNPSSTELFQ